MHIKGYIKDIDSDCITITAPFKDYMSVIRQDITECEIRLDDGRRISADQRKKIYALLRDISEWSGHEAEFLKSLMKCDYIANTGNEHFSLSDCSMTTARLFLEHLIEFCIQNGVPCADALYKICPDIGRYVYMCLANNRCCISGGRCELHHVNAVGMGRDRKIIVHEGLEVLPLNRRYHKEIHDIGNAAFCEKYHIEPVKLDKKLCEIYKLRSAA